MTGFRGLISAAAAAGTVFLLATGVTVRAQDAASNTAATLAAGRAQVPARSAFSGFHRRALKPPPAVVAPPVTPPAAPPALPALPGARLAPGTPIPPTELEAFVDGVVRQGMLGEHIPGVAVSVVQGGQVLLNKGYGFASFTPRRPVDPDTTLFRLGAISTSFTWIGVLREVEHGRMRLDAPINLYLPEKLQVRDQGYAEPVTLRDVMDQSPGFEDRALGRLYEREPDRVRAMETYLRQEKPRRVLPPGLRPEYSAYGAALGGEALSQVRGQPFETLMDTELLRPLGMAHTSFREPRPAAPGLPAPLAPALAQGVATGYRWTGQSLQPRPFGFAGQIAPAGSASSTAADMGRYMTLLLGGGTLGGATIYGPATAQGLRTALLRGAPDVDGWTAGLMQQRLPGGFEAFGLTGQTLSFHARMVTAPALNLGVFVAGNSDSAGNLTQRLPELIVEHFYATPPGGPPAGGDPAALRQAYDGHYVSEARRYGGLEKFVGLLRRTAVVDADARGFLLIRSPDGSQVWAQDGAAGQFRALGSSQRSAFQLQDGRAVRWFEPTGHASYARVGWFLQPAGLATLAGLSLIASLATLIGLFVRDRREFRQTQVQRRASALQTTASVLWLMAMAAFGVWAWGALADEARSFFEWPSGFILIASACALVAAVASLGQLIMLPVVWRGGRRLDSWTGGRKFSFTLTVAVYATFSVALALWGALEPWNS